MPFLEIKRQLFKRKYQFIELCVLWSWDFKQLEVLCVKLSSIQLNKCYMLVTI